jgi:Tol biopolymer transport system component/DNA-binding winged helix-turn-helix (wHTH) protein
VSANVQFLRRAPEIRHARYNGWTVDVAANRLQRGDSDVRLTPKAMAVLRELLARPATVVRRDDLLGIVWRDGFPTDDVLTHAITELRRALDDDPRAPRLIETIPKVGYRLLGTVEVLDGPPGPATTPGGNGDAGPEAVAPGPVAWRLVAAFAALAAIAIAVPVLRGPRAPTVRPPAPAAPVAPVGLRPFAITADPQREQFPSVSPDGASVAYVLVNRDEDTARILLRSMDTAGQPVTQTDPPENAWDSFPSWSPDGKQIAFLRTEGDRCHIMVMPALLGQARRVASCFTRVVDYIDWTADGTGLLVARGDAADGSGVQPAVAGRVSRIDLATGATTMLEYAPRGNGDGDLQPRASPDGRWIAFRRGAAPYSDLWVMPSTGGTAERLTELGARIRGYAWLPDSSRLIISSDHEGRQALYEVDRRNGWVVPLGITQAVFPSIARQVPVLVYQQETELTQLTEYTLDPATRLAERRPLVPSTRSDWLPSLSPGGRKLAFVSLRSGDPQMWVHDYDAGSTFPATRVERMEVGLPQWSPDEASVLYVTRGGGASVLMRADLSSGRNERLSAPNERVRFGSYSRDGRSIYFSTDRSGSWQIWRMSATGGEEKQLSQAGGYDPRDWLGDGAIYYAKETDRGLFRLDLVTREETRASWDVGYWNMDAVALQDGFVYFIEYSHEDGDAWVVRSPLISPGQPLTAAQETGAQPEHLYRLPAALLMAEVSFAPDLRRLVAVVVARDETDLMGVNLAPPVVPVTP